MRSLHTIARTLCGGLFLALTAAGGAQAQAWLSFDIPGQSGVTGPTAINGHSLITGLSGVEAVVGFVRKPDGTSYTFGGDATVVVGIDDKGVVGGRLGQGFSHGFYVGQDQVMHQFDVPGAMTTLPTGMNAKGDIVGDVSGGVFIRHADGTFETFGDGNMLAVAINNKRTVMGVPFNFMDGSHHVFLRGRHKGTVTTFDVPDSANGLLPVAINNDDTVVGNYVDSGNLRHGFLRRRDGTLTIIDVPGATAPDGTVITGLNDAGDIVGYYASSWGSDHGFTRTPDGTIKTFDAPGSWPGHTFFTGVGPDGKVVGRYLDNDGKTHGLRLNATAAGF